MNIIRYQEPEVAAWPPFERLSTLREEMNRLLDGSLAGYVGNAGLFGGWTPPLDVTQDKDNIFVKIELPGMKKEAIDISLHDGTLSISGERKEEAESGKGETFRTERYFGRFHRTITLPTPVDAGNVKATYRDGILTVELPKAEEAKPKQIEVNVS
jgi:HSP20 family protein